MSDSPGRHLKVGDKAVTFYNGGIRPKTVTIKSRCDDGSQGRSQSGILYQVTPALRDSTEDCWFDADWFLPEPRGQRA